MAKVQSDDFFFAYHNRITLGSKPTVDVFLGFGWFCFQPLLYLPVGIFGDNAKHTECCIYIVTDDRTIIYVLVFSISIDLRAIS